ncbi:MAG: PRC-barrel domain-containing protein [Myxococcales bacterium]|nr:PRC-barrel domain-containing protein [Myxococcales bacterium]
MPHALTPSIDVAQVVLYGFWVFFFGLIYWLRREYGLEGHPRTVFTGPDPRGWDVVGGDDELAGKVKDIWVDRANMLVRYLEVELGEGTGATGTRLIPMPLIRLSSDTRRVEVSAILAKHFGQVPSLKNPARVDVMEELVSAFCAGGKRFAAVSGQGLL